MSGKQPVLKHSEIVFMYAADDEAYKAYGTTFVGWGGAHTKEEVQRHHGLGIRCTGSMWCLTAGPELLHKNPELQKGVALDIESKPIMVPWLFDQVYEGMRALWGCTNNPIFRELCRRRVREAMAGGADGLHVDDHAGSAAAAMHGGGFCDYCMAGFREYLKDNASAADLRAAGVKDLDTFDYRTLVRKYAKTRQEYMKVQNRIPLTFSTTRLPPTFGSSAASHRRSPDTRSCCRQMRACHFRTKTMSWTASRTQSAKSRSSRSWARGESQPR